MGSSSDTNLATTFARTDVGVLGITLFLEVRPNATWPNPGNDAMKAITYSFINVHRATNITPSSYSTFKSQTKYQSAAWVRKSDGSGNLVTDGDTSLTNALNSDPSSTDCAGLLRAYPVDTHTH